MGKKIHTIILVPHARARLRKWRVSDRQILALVAVLVTLTLAGGFFTWGFFSQSVDNAEIERLRQENESLRTVNSSFESSVLDLQEKLAAYEDRTLELAIVAGLDPSATGGEAGLGGEDEALSLDDLDLRTQRLEGTLDQVEAELQERLRWISSTPAITPAKGILTSGFGSRSDPFHGARTFHGGVDIAAAPGAPVHATADGVVTLAGRNGGLGKAVFVSHGYGLVTRYGHMSGLAVKAGQRVKRGDVIGYVGNTGRSTGYHLHYEVHLDGEPVNPAAYLLDRSGG